MTDQYKELDWLLIEYGVAVFSKNQINTDPEYYEEHQMPREAHLKTLEALIQYIEKREVESRAGWTLEAPDLPYFQISFFNKNNTALNNDEPYANWTSPIMDTKKLPLQINKPTNLKEGNHD